MFKIYNKYGLNDIELKKLFIRLTQFIILDNAIQCLEVAGKDVTSQELYNLLFNKLGKENCPTISSLQPYIDAYKFSQHHDILERQVIRTGEISKCNFNLGCCVSSREIIERSHIEMHKDHLIPISWKGNDDTTNVQFLCKRHNHLKGNQIFWNDGILPLEGWHFDF